MDFIDSYNLKVKSGLASSILLDPEVPRLSSGLVLFNLRALFSSAVSHFADTVTSLPMAPGFYLFSRPLQEEENVLFIQNSSNINFRIGTHWF